MDQNQPPDPDEDAASKASLPTPLESPSLEEEFISLRAQAHAEAPPELHALTERLRRGLFAWLIALLVGSGVFLMLGAAEAALLLAIAGLFALAQATDVAAAAPAYRGWVRATLPRTRLLGAMFRGLVRSIVPLGGALLLVGFAAFALQDLPGPRQRIAATWAGIAALLCLTLAARPVADAVSRRLFHSLIPTRTERLTARVTALALLAFPTLSALHPELLEVMSASTAELVTPQGLVAQMIGLVTLGFAGVGLGLKRDWRQTRERLGLTAMTRAHWVWVAVGLAGISGVNLGMEWFEKQYFPALALADEQATRMIVAHLTLGATIVLGITAGVGEEITVRGALQPRLGLLLSSLLFASGHVQYTWFGVLTVGLLGATLGLIRQRTNTTTAIVVHALYNIVAALSAQ